MRDFLEYYPSLRELSIYDDRIHQIDAFKSFFHSLDLPRLKWSAIPVRPFTKALPREQELEMVMDMVRKNNSQALSTSQKFDLRRTPRQIGYILCTASHRLLSIEVIKYLRRRKGEERSDPSCMNIPCIYRAQNPVKISLRLKSLRYGQTMTLARLILRRKYSISHRIFIRNSLGSASYTSKSQTLPSSSRPTTTEESHWRFISKPHPNQTDTLSLSFQNI